MGQVARHKAAKAEARERAPRPLYQLRRRESRYWRDRQQAEMQFNARLAVARQAVHAAVFEPVYAALLARVHAHNLAAGVYGPGHSGALH